MALFSSKYTHWRTGSLDFLRDNELQEKKMEGVYACSVIMKALFYITPLVWFLPILKHHSPSMTRKRIKKESIS